MAFDIHKYSTETFWGVVVVGAIFLFVALALGGIRPWWAACIALMLICDLGIYAFFVHYDPQSKPPVADTPHGGLLIPATDSDPTLSANKEKVVRDLCAKHPDTLKVFLGSAVAISVGSPRVLIRVAGKNLLTIHRTDSGISIDAMIFDDSGKIIAQIENNSFFVNPNNFFRIERPDMHTLIVYDQKADRVLELRYLNLASVRVLGIFRFAGRTPISITEDGLTIGGVQFNGCMAITGEGGDLNSGVIQCN